MSLAPGTKLGPYEILAQIGAGGMGEVYRARDARLQRDVAIKVLPEQILEDGRRKVRFEREARALAALNHSGIAAIYAFEEIAGRAVLTMELVEGEPLNVRIARGSLPLNEALSIARQIAEALEAAHEKGIVHRDLKPSNVHVSPGGKVKLLDFGLAKAFEAESAVSFPEMTQTPTLTSPDTVAGTILGTPSYMAPEQARGKPVDKRADVWAFGVVLYEMLTSQRAFTGDTPSDVMAAVLTRDPDWNALPATTPAAVAHLLRRCLTRDIANRLHDIADARIELTEPTALPRIGEATAAAGSRVKARSVMAATLAAAIIATAVATGFFVKKSMRTEPLRFRTLTWSFGSVFSGRFTPDGQNVIYSAELEGRPPALFSSRVDAVDSRRLDLPMGDVVGISKTGEMALLLGRHNVGSWLRIGTLAHVSVSGGSPRPVLEEVFDADISPDGASFAVVVADGAGQRLEYPIGHVVYRNTGWIAHPRISSDGKRLAFADYATEGDDEGTVVLLDAGGRVTRLSKTLDYLQGLAWSPSGEEIWATGYELERGTTLWAFSPSKPPRALLGVPSVIHIVDVAADGTILLSYDETHVELEGRLAGDEKPRTYSWWRANVVSGISDDGSVYAGDGAVSVAEGGMITFYRRSDGTPPVRIGFGNSAGISPDGRTVFVRTAPNKLEAIPTGPGQPRTYELGAVEPQVSGIRLLSFSADGKRAAFAGVAPGSGRSGYVLDVAAGGLTRSVTPVGGDHVLLSPDASSLAAVADGGVRLYALDGGPPKVVPATQPKEIPVAWESSGRALFVWDRGIPARIYRIDLATGKRTLGLELTPRNPAGVLYGFLRVSPNLTHYLFRFRRRSSYLCTTTGVR
ncbi:MAG TPA: protein kinase [Thermoanaerobaculia bacterium]